MIIRHQPMCIVRANGSLNSTAGSDKSEVIKISSAELSGTQRAAYAHTLRGLSPLAYQVEFMTPPTRLNSTAAIDSPTPILRTPSLGFKRKGKTPAHNAF